MEVLSTSILSKPHLSSSISPFTSSLTTLRKKTPFKFRKSLLKSFPNSSFSSTLPLQTSKNSHITARFGRPTKRRNSLRKKLTGGGDDLKVRENPQKFVEEAHHFDDNQIIDSNLGSNLLEKDSEVVGSSQFHFDNSNIENSRQFGDSVLWDKLEGWVEQYKKDIEYWGIGSNPIFTVFQDSNGGVEQVLVDEDEILKRNGVEPLFFREENELKAFDEVKLKLAHAKFLAKESKSEKNVFPKNSSVAKFVVSGESSGFVSRIKNMFVPQMSPAKVSRVAIVVACGFLVVSVINKLFTFGGKKAEVTSFEKEMLRRKKTSRMMKEKLQKSNVEVVEEPFDPPTVVTERPLLDREEVLNSIREAKGLNNSFLMLDVGGSQETESVVMDTKIREIQMMARQAREVERGEGLLSEGDDLDEKITEEMQLEKKMSAEGLEDSVWIDELEKQDSWNGMPLTEVEDVAESRVVGDKNLVDKPASDKNGETGIVNGSAEIETLDELKVHSKDGTFTGENEKVSERNEDVKLHSISGERIMDDKKVHDVSDSLELTEGIHSYVSKSQVNPPKETSARRKPKIIRSVKEAREYLMRKHNKKSEDGDIPANAAAENGGMNSQYSQRQGENDQVSDSSDANRKVDHAPPPKVSRNFVVKRNEFLATDTNGSKVAIESELKLNNSGIDTTQNFGKTMQIDEILRPSDSHERSIPVASEIKFCETNQEATEPIASEQSLDKADKFDEMSELTDLGEISEHVSGRNSSHYASNSTEKSGMPHDNALHDASLQKKEHLSIDNANVKLDRTIEPPTTEPGEMDVPASVGKDVNGLASEESDLALIETKDEDSYAKNHVASKPLGVETFQGSGSSVEDSEGVVIADKEKWLEKNFHEVEPIVKKIGSGFRDNYNFAREKTKQEDQEFDLMRLGSIKDGTELEWMQDDKLREIVFKVRENELAGRDPFHSMDPEDKVAFFEGLENKVEIENQKLSALHEWLHLNIENVDYGADGISLYDPPEKVIPQWKGPPLDQIPDFLNNSRDQQQVGSSLQKVNESKKPDNIAKSSTESSPPKSVPREKVSKFSKTVIEASDGSVKPGKKSGKEFWQHTKKWSRGFVESYNAETDPEAKSVMKDIGKDLDRWITEKEIQESADLMERIPQKGKEIVEKKLNKLKREMELYGPQAVVSKYREYAEVKEEDYLWWLDLPHLLCIELYTYEGEDQRVGFYSLEMAGDLEIEPKPHHVIAFEDPSDCKNFCYIMQAHLEMLGNGKAFIVPQPPKDVFWQAKANGFGVTVIRKAELKLNVDQALEEVEELITEIGSKMYHDKIMRERSVDISSLMKGVFGVSPPSKRKRKKRARKRPSKS